MKLKSFYKNNIYIITQNNHGAYQSFMAFDFGFSGALDKNYYAPANLKFKRQWGSGYDGGCEYWVTDCKNVFIQFVHITPLKFGDVATGQMFATAKGDHGHITLNVEGKWQVYLDYAERDAQLSWWTLGGTHIKYTNWATYTDKQLTSLTSYEMIKLQIPIKILTTNTANLNVREKPDTSSKIIATIPTATAFTTDILASGTVVNGNGTWYGVLNGYISGAWVKELQSDCSVEKETIKKLTEEVATLTANLNATNARIDEFIKAEGLLAEKHNALKGVISV